MGQAPAISKDVLTNYERELLSKVDLTLDSIKMVRKPDDLPDIFRKLVVLKQQVAGVFRNMQD